MQPFRWPAAEPIDMRVGAERLLARMVQVFGAAHAHHGYLFANALGTRIQLTLLTQAVMVRATIDVYRMSAQQKVELADEIYVQQPNLLASIPVLSRYEVDILQLEVAIHVLLVAPRP